MPNSVLDLSEVGTESAVHRASQFTILFATDVIFEGNFILKLDISRFVIKRQFSEITVL